MIFQIHHHFKNVACYPEPEAVVESYSWTLDKKDGTPLIRSARENFETEKEARSDIASVRKTIKGAAFAKVQSP